LKALQALRLFDQNYIENMTILNSQTGNMAASGDEEKHNLVEETASLLVVLNEEIGNQKASVEALQIELKSLRAHVDNTNTHVLRPTSSSTIKQDSNDDNDLLYALPSDTFTLMMVYNPLTPAWNIGIFSFILQMLLLILILISQLNEGDGSTLLNVPYQIDTIARIGQYAVTFLCLLSQEDVLTSLQSICALWKCDCTAFQKLFVNSHDLSASGHDLFAHYDDSPIQASAEAKRKYCDHFFIFAFCFRTCSSLAKVFASLLCLWLLLLRATIWLICSRTVLLYSLCLQLTM
jgi:hypothetical protein